MPEYPDNNPKTIYGVQKPAIHLIPPPALLHMAAAFAEGARKYGAYNWREKKVSTSIYTGASLRHLMSFMDGEDIDPESGKKHLGHVLACIGIILDAEAVGNLNDDRPLPAPTGQLIRSMTEANNG